MPLSLGTLVGLGCWGGPCPGGQGGCSVPVPMPRAGAMGMLCDWYVGGHVIAWVWVGGFGCP